jgi:type II secretion system protein G
MRNEKGFTLIELLIVVAIIGIIAAIAIPSLLNALDRARQTTTVENVQKLGQSVEIYIIDFNRIGAPGAADVDALNTILVETEINDNESMTLDGWGAQLIYEKDGGDGSRRYTVMSYGSDSAAGPDPDTAGVVVRFTEDIIFSNGRFTQQPRGRQTSGE